MAKRRRTHNASPKDATPTDALVSWAVAQGVELAGIQPRAIPGRGVGIVATRKLKVSRNFDQSILTWTDSARRKEKQSPMSLLRLIAVFTPFPPPFPVSCPQT